MPQDYVHVQLSAGQPHKYRSASRRCGGLASASTSHDLVDGNGALVA